LRQGFAVLLELPGGLLDRLQLLICADEVSLQLFDLAVFIGKLPVEVAELVQLHLGEL